MPSPSDFNSTLNSLIVSRYIVCYLSITQSAPHTVITFTVQHNHLLKKS